MNVLLSSTWVMGSGLHPSQNMSSLAPESPPISVWLLQSEKGLRAHPLSLNSALAFPDLDAVSRCGDDSSFRNPMGERLNIL